ncbi:MAG: RNA-binding protein [Candidatus Sericytochromatia bacterium]|nr:RNA-binding protein [Candidatus Sericytochromatia bacterium]
MKVFIGNLTETVTEEELTQAAAAYGTVSSASLALDDEGVSKGFGFVEMASAAEGQALIAGLHGKDFKGQALKVNEARPDKKQTRNVSRSPGVGFGSRPVAGSQKAKGSGSKGGFNIGTTGRNKV